MARGSSASDRSSMEEGLRRQRPTPHSRRGRCSTGESLRARRTDADARHRRNCRARSASEAFFYRRLQSLPSTTGLFNLNEALAIPFGGKATMEVDFLCPEAKLVLELDGAQHLADPNAYRSDREK